MVPGDWQSGGQEGTRKSEERGKRNLRCRLEMRRGTEEKENATVKDKSRKRRQREGEEL